jgi:hypothetical protein
VRTGDKQTKKARNEAAVKKRAANWKKPQGTRKEMKRQKERETTIGHRARPRGGERERERRRAERVEHVEER